MKQQPRDLVQNITQPDDNLFSALGFSDGEAARLQAESDREIALLINMKKQMMTEIAQWMQAQAIRQVDAAAIMHISRPRVSDVVNLKTEKFTLDALIGMATSIGKKVHLVVE